MLRKDYQPLTDSHVDRLRQDAMPVLGAMGMMTLPAKTIYMMAMELIDAREEIFRLQLCETVDKILANELGDDDVDIESIRWPDDYTFGGEALESGVHKPAFPCKDTQRLDTSRYPATVELNPDDEGRRLPRLD